MVHGALSQRTGWAATKKSTGAAGCAALRLAWRAATARTAGRRSQRHMLGRRPGGSAATWLRIRAAMSPMPVPKIALKIQALAAQPTPPMAPKRHRSLATSAIPLRPTSARIRSAKSDPSLRLSGNQTHRAHVQINVARSCLESIDSSYRSGRGFRRPAHIWSLVRRQGE